MQDFVHQPYSRLGADTGIHTATVVTVSIVSCLVFRAGLRIHAVQVALTVPAECFLKLCVRTRVTIQVRTMR